MPVRATKRGSERTALGGEYDALVCGASFAGLAAARELSGSGRRVLMLDRYAIGERQTSACAIPTDWLTAMDLSEAVLQTFQVLTLHRPHRTFRWELPFTFSTFDYPLVCELLKAQSPDVPFETAKVNGRTGDVIHTDRGDLRAPLILDALGWRRVLSNETPIQPPEARLSRGLEVHPDAQGDDLEVWLDAKYVKAGYSWAFPAGGEVRAGVGAFDPRVHVKQPTLQLVQDIGLEAEGWQGNWIPHRLRPAVEGGVFFAGDSAGHCLPLTAEGIRTGLYFGLAVGREMRAALDGRQSRSSALRRYGDFSDAHRSAFDWLWRVQTLVSGAMPYPVLDSALRAMNRQSFVDWSFSHYYSIASPRFVRAHEWPQDRKLERMRAADVAPFAVLGPAAARGRDAPAAAVLPATA